MNYGSRFSEDDRSESSSDSSDSDNEEMKFGQDSR